MRTIIGVMGGGTAEPGVLDDARELGRLVAENGWVLLNGGRNAGVMTASAEGASLAGGLVVGILPDADREGASPHIDIAIPTGMGDARNAINVLASDVVVALRGGAGTLSEIALALKSCRPVVALAFPLGAEFSRYRASGALVDAATPGESVERIRSFLAKGQR